MWTCNYSVFGFAKVCTEVQRRVFVNIITTMARCDAQYGRVLILALGIIGQSEISNKLVPGTPLLELLRWGRSKQASDPKDKVFGLLGLSDLSYRTHPGLKVDYSRTVREVYIGIVQAVVEITSRLDFLCFSFPGAVVSKSEVIPRTDRTVLPSWVPDWRIYNDSIFFSILSMPIKGAGEDSPACAELRLDEGILCTAGFRIGTVKKCGACLSAMDGYDHNPQE